MKLEFLAVDVEKELRRLREFDKKLFSKGDLFPAAFWRECEVWWMLVDGKRVGCCAMQPEVDADGALAITSTGILAEWQGMGLGRVMKAWQVAYARRHGYQKIVTTSRAGNSPMIQLNKSFGFRVVRKIPRYYCDPEETGVEMELKL